ncbi:thiamine phosphate synthase [Chloracidobacterium validum]|uniref:Thiamine phosphate synthase n=1 Tax=Chloracidobacterium validum TaxID=2821543 RepID=A0ABX8B6Q8_9BACT|nr:thiamine phosphate synthase [Chloracidobacterium validum]QUW02649.1 thiamine phosphate synthase [Chloracidobacterium validum]
MRRYLITDRQQLFHAGEAYDEATARQRLVRLACFAAAQGIDYLQLREKDLSARALTQMAAAMVAALSGSRTKLLVNDRLDVAYAAGAHGVHLTARSLPPAVVRRCVPPGFLIAVSTHNRAEIAAAEDAADFAVCGPVFPSGNKPVLGLEAFAALARETTLPLFALGGVNRDNAPLVAAAGAAGIASIRAFTQAFLESEAKTGRTVDWQPRPK